MTVKKIISPSGEKVPYFMLETFEAWRKDAKVLSMEEIEREIGLGSNRFDIDYIQVLKDELKVRKKVRFVFR